MERDYPNLIWEMYATSPEGEKVYCGSSMTAAGANALFEHMRSIGYTNTEKNQVLIGNHGYSMLPRMRQ